MNIQKEESETVPLFEKTPNPQSQSIFLRVVSLVVVIIFIFGCFTAIIVGIYIGTRNSPTVCKDPPKKTTPIPSYKSSLPIEITNAYLYNGIDPPKDKMCKFSLFNL